MMNDLAEISCLWQWYNQYLKVMRMFPTVPILQKNAAIAQAKLVMAQAIYFQGIRR